MENIRIINNKLATAVPSFLLVSPIALLLGWLGWLLGGAQLALMAVGFVVILHCRHGWPVAAS